MDSSRKFKSALLQTLARTVPRACLLCDQRIADTTQPARQRAEEGAIHHDRRLHVCDFCCNALRFNHSPKQPACRGCAKTGLVLVGEGRCGRCILSNTSSVVVAALQYDHLSRHLIHRFKFHHGFAEGVLLAQLLAAEVRTAYQQSHRHEQPDKLPDALVPVPLSRLNLTFRGYNQAALLCRTLERELGIPKQIGLMRRKHGKPQRHRSLSERKRLPVQTFSVSGQRQYNHVAIIDDVLTTGRTTEIIKQLLLQAGHQRVDIWCTARVV